MRLFRTVFIVAIILAVLGLRLGAEDWSKVYKRTVADHLVILDIRLEGQPDVRGMCSGVVVAYGQVLTAAHCLLNTEMPAQTGYVDGKAVHVLHTADKIDLVLVEARTKGKRPIVIPFAGPDPGTPIAAIGQASGDTHPSISPMTVMTTQGGIVYVNNTLLKGYSGGPLVTLQGHLAGIMVATNLEWGFALGIDITTIRAFLGSPAVDELLFPRMLVRPAREP